MPVYRGVQSELTGYTLAFVVMSQPTSPSVSQHAALDDYESVSTEGFLGSLWTHIHLRGLRGMPVDGGSGGPNQPQARSHPTGKAIRSGLVAIGAASQLQLRDASVQACIAQATTLKPHHAWMNS